MRAIILTALACLAFVTHVVAQQQTSNLTQPTTHPPNGTVICDAVEALNCLSVGPHGSVAIYLYAHPEMWWRGTTTVLSGINIVPNSQHENMQTFIVSMQCFREDADATTAYHINLNNVAGSQVAMPSPSKQATGAFHDVTFAPPLVVEGVGVGLTLSTSKVLPPAAAATCNVQGYFAP
jgi:hypothetical protein